MDRVRPAPRWCYASTGLDDFAIVTWAVDPERLARCLPGGFEPDVRDGRALVSAVAFLDDAFHFRVSPWPRISCGQVNYRAYVRRGEETGVWFFGTSLDSGLVRIPRLVWQMPWYRDRVRIDADWSATGCESWRLQADGNWGIASIALRGTGRPFEAPPGYGDETEVSELLLDPFVGWYGRRNGSGVGRYSVWHHPLELEQATVEVASCQVFDDLGLIDDGQMPISAGVQRTIQFDVHTPPSRQR